MAFMLFLCRVLNKCIYHLHLGPSPLYRINDQHDFQWWSENKRIVLHDKR